MEYSWGDVSSQSNPQREKITHGNTMYCTAPFFFLAAVYLLCLLFFSFFLFFKRVKILCLCKCHPGGFDIITVLPPSAKQTILQLLFCVRCRKKKRKRWAPKEQSRRQVPACACVSVYHRVCVRVQQRKWDEKKVRFTLQRMSNLPLFQKLSFLVRRTNRDEGWTWRLNSHSKGLALWNWMCTHQYRVTCW